MEVITPESLEVAIRSWDYSVEWHAIHRPGTDSAHRGSACGRIMADTLIDAAHAIRGRHSLTRHAMIDLLHIARGD